MTGEEGYGEEGYTVVGQEYYVGGHGYGRLPGFLAFVAGGLVGAGITLLFSPQAGKKTREQLRQASKVTKGRVEALYVEAKEELDKVLDKGKDLVRDGGPLLTAAIEAGKEAYEKERQRRMESGTPK